MDNPIDVYIIGTGMVGQRQMTNEGEAALEESTAVYLVHHHALFEEYLSEFELEVHDLTEKYERGRRRENTYERMATTVLEAGESADDPVTLALYGHPLVFVSPSRWVMERGNERGLNVETRPGISSVDCLYVDLGLDPAKNGIQMFEATDLLLREFELNPDVPAMIWQVGVVESHLYDPHDNKPERFSRLRAYLQQYYPDDHTVSLVQTATYPISESQRIDFGLDEFESMHEEITAIQTLYVPPVRERPVENEELAALVASRDHLETITEE